MSVTQERVATPWTCTVQAPQSAMPQPTLVPVNPSTSRNTHRSGVSPSTSTVRSIPLTLIVVGIVPPDYYVPRGRAASVCCRHPPPRQRAALSLCDALGCPSNVRTKLFLSEPTFP